MNKMRSLCRTKVQQAGSEFNTSLSAANWLSLWSLPEGPVIRAFNFLLFRPSSCDSQVPATDPHLLYHWTQVCFKQNTFPCLVFFFFFWSLTSWICMRYTDGLSSNLRQRNYMWRHIETIIKSHIFSSELSLYRSVCNYSVKVRA